MLSPTLSPIGLLPENPGMTKTFSEPPEARVLFAEPPGGAGIDGVSQAVVMTPNTKLCKIYPLPQEIE